MTGALNSENGLHLAGRLLVAMPAMDDPRFEQSVVLICDYSQKGAMGLILNKVTDDIRMSDVLDQLEIEPTEEARSMPVHFGGPVETGRGFVLHSGDYQSALHTLAVPGGFGMTATLDILEEIAKGEGPKRALMMLGYAGWGPGQLESEIARNGWLIAEGSQRLVFGTAARLQWLEALKTMGVDPVLLSSEAGHA
ncbi:YqgE/AlgH family protein [uncultured Roseobacter sp.]|uniref:YqgE/AlgH family protein n=1 Tax=uncultured Roseobacter sp. TaxID=114847 RepID=UPI002634C8FD|nr:YqgE/AlgH family protein [uncultured Roseobacter sp.]